MKFSKLFISTKLQIIVFILLLITIYMVHTNIIVISYRNNNRHKNTKLITSLIVFKLKVLYIFFKNNYRITSIFEWQLSINKKA